MLRAVALLALVPSFAFAEPGVVGTSSAASGPNAEPTVEPLRLGWVVATGVDLMLPSDHRPVRAGLRAGGGVRFGLGEPEAEGHTTLPAVAVVGGFQGHDSSSGFLPGGFLEARLELVVARRHRFLQPSLVAYAIGGAQLRGDGVKPYFGLGVGWDLPMFAFAAGEPQVSGKAFSGLGNLGSSSGALALPALLVAGAAVVGFVFIGRLEVRHLPLSNDGAPASTSILIGLGF